MAPPVAGHGLMSRKMAPTTHQDPQQFMHGNAGFQDNQGGMRKSQSFVGGGVPQPQVFNSTYLLDTDFL